MMPVAETEHKLGVAEIVLAGLHANAVCRQAGLEMVGIKNEADFLKNVIELTSWALNEIRDRHPRDAN